MQGNLPRSLSLIVGDEGGYAEREREPGGAVNRGVSFLVFKEWRKRRGKPEPTLDDLRTLTDIEAREIYTVKFAEPLRFRDLKMPLDYVACDAAIMEGVRGAIMLLQKALGVPETGRYDIKTLEALAKAGPLTTALMLCVHHLNKKLHYEDSQTFDDGWGDRIVRRANRALDMMR